MATPVRISLSICIPLLVSACTASDDGEPFAPGTNTTDAASESGHADHADDHGDDSGSGSSSSTPTPGSSGGDDTGAGSSGESGTATGTTGAVAADTWESWALPQFFELYCNQCHPAAGQSARDFSDYDTVVANEEHIRCGVAPEAIEGCDPGHIEPGHLPIGPGPYPSDDERWRLVDWVLAGMPRDR